jgi:hypothetical protein
MIGTDPENDLGAVLGARGSRTCISLFLGQKILGLTGLATLDTISITDSSPCYGLRRLDGRRRISNWSLAPALG